MDRSINVFIQVLKDLWVGDSDLIYKQACSEWIMDQIDLRGWEHFMSNENDGDLFVSSWGSYVVNMLIPPIDIVDDMKMEYWKILEKYLLIPIRELYPELYSRIVDFEKKRIEETINNLLSNKKT